MHCMGVQEVSIRYIYVLLPLNIDENFFEQENSPPSARYLMQSRGHTFNRNWAHVPSSAVFESSVHISYRISFKDMQVI